LIINNLVKFLVDITTQMEKKKKFLKLPKYEGGKQGIKKIIDENLKYPAQALENKIEGTVLLSFTVDAMGKVQTVRVVHGIGYGCDEEAARVIKLLEFEKAINKGIRVTMQYRMKIHFRLPTPPQNTVQLTYTYTQKKEEPLPKNNSYSYSIRW
jgi:TonB family protein